LSQIEEEKLDLGELIGGLTAPLGMNLLAAKGCKDLKRQMFDPYSAAKIARDARELIGKEAAKSYLFCISILKAVSPTG